MSEQDEEAATISIPSLIVVGLLIFLSYRYFFSSRSTSGAGGASNGLRFTAAQVEQIAQMFPQLSRRDIMWDLHRNRGSVQATTERVLMGRGLEVAPPSFQPPISLVTSTSSTPSAASVTTGKIEPDLITRYNLHSRISVKGKEKEVDLPTPGWTSNKDDRQKMLQRRRDEMILAARRKMQEKDSEGAPPIS